MKAFVKASQEFTHGDELRKVGDVFATNPQDANNLIRRGLCVESEDPKAKESKPAAKKTAQPKK